MERGLGWGTAKVAAWTLASGKKEGTKKNLVLGVA